MAIRPTSLRILLAAGAVIAWATLATFGRAQSPATASDALSTAPDLPQSLPGEPLSYEAIRKIVRAEIEAENARKTAVPGPAPAPEWIEVGKDRSLDANWTNGFIAESADKCFRYHIGGRMEFDNSWFAQDNNILIGNSPTQEMRDGTLFRRARLRADGRLWEFIDFACEVNFANIQDVSNVDDNLVQVGSVGLTDMFVTFREVPWLGNVRMGHLQAPISLERYTGSNAWFYMERSSMWDAFYNPNDYQNGVSAFDSYFDDRVTLAGSFAWVGKSDVQSFGFGAHEGKYGGGVRLTALPWYTEEGRSLVHLGAGYFHQSMVDHKFSIASRPLLRAGAGGGQTPNLIFTGTFFSPNGVDIANVEAAMVHGPLSISAEYAVTHITDVFETANFTGPRGNVTYQAAYVEAGLFVTPGDQRRYDQKTGTWNRTIPQQNGYLVGEDGCRIWSPGAIQLLARYTILDLVAGNPILTPTGGGARAGIQQDVTLGVNWYLNSQTCFMVNYVGTHIDSVVAGADGDIHGIGCRLHLDF